LAAGEPAALDAAAEAAADGAALFAALLAFLLLLLLLPHAMAMVVAVSKPPIISNDDRLLLGIVSSFRGDSC
jgi:hypothetical protein